MRIEDLERQIDDTRHSLDRTLTDLQFRLSPREQAKLAWRSMGRSAPFVLVALGVAAVLFLRATRPRRPVR